MRFIKDYIRSIKKYEAGKSKEEVARKYKLKNIIKLASNENPLGAPPSVLKLFNEGVEDIHLYPDPEANELREEIAKYIGLKKENITVTNGSDEALELFVKLFLDKGEKAIIPIPTFPIYDTLVRIFGGKVVNVQLKEEKNFEFDAKEIIREIDEKTKLVFICSPNNPTGAVIDEESLLKILNKDVVVVLDEVYAEFSEISYVKLVNEYENLVVARSFSKTFGLAGLRLGYAVACEEVTDYLHRIKLPFNVSKVSQKAGILAIRDREHIERTVELIKNQRKFLFEELSRIEGIKVYPSKANFLLIKLSIDAEHVVEELMKRGIIVRNMSNLKGLNKNYIRVSIGLENENKEFLSNFLEIIKEHR